MYKILLRNVITGEMHWYDNCYLNDKLERGKVIRWKSPKDEHPVKYKIVSWNWQGYDSKKTAKDKEIERLATAALLSLDIPSEWRDVLRKYTE